MKKEWNKPHMVAVARGSSEENVLGPSREWDCACSDAGQKNCMSSPCKSHVSAVPN
jgi:hypothetical protein